ncbi:5'-nucleotidase domain containing hypothetical protein, partial [Phytophthora palmivora]
MRDIPIKELQKNFANLGTILPAEWLPSIAQRGVVVDTARGNFLHLGEDGSILRAYHGSHEISYFSISVLYGNTAPKDDDISSLLGGSSKLIHLYTAADIIYAPLYAWIVDAFDSGVIVIEDFGRSLYLVPDIQDEPPGNPNDPFLANKVVYVSLSGFALKAARSFYAGAFWKTITTTPDLLIQPNADIVTLLEILKTNLGKQLFILTNGSWTHCNTVMQFAVGRNWMNYFDLVVTEANKEVFFDDFNDTMFSELTVDNSVNSATAGGRAQKKVVTMLQRRKVYAHGNVKTLMTFFSENTRKSTSTLITAEKDQRICYFGDHVMQDILLPARFTTTWDLVAIVKEIQNIGQPSEAILHNGRYVPNSELGAIPKRVIAKVRSIDPSSKTEVMNVVNLAEEVLSGVLQAAEQLQNAVVGAESGCIESLRWAGAMPLLLRDFNVQNVLAAEDFWNCATSTDLRRLLLVDENESVGHVVLLLSGFLWDYEMALKRLLALGVVHRLTVCSSLSERAHECYDFRKLGGDAALPATGARATKTMKFEEFAAELNKNATFPMENGAEVKEEWGWEDTEESVGHGVQVVHLPLNVVPLLSNKTWIPEPSVFVLSHPTCASAFPLLLHQVENVTVTSPASPTGRGGAGIMTGGVKKYTHVKDVLPEHIPSAFRSKILEAGEPTNPEHSSLVELGVIVLETLERMDQTQKRWDKCHDRVTRQLELRKKGGHEWILPEVADVMQRQMSTAQLNEEIISLQELLALLVNAFALSSGVPLEDFTIQMVQKALVENVLH